MAGPDSAARSESAGATATVATPELVAQLEAQVLELRRSRDAALGELATAKAKLSAHLLSCPFQFTPAQEEITAYLKEGGPLRYRVVDALNDGLKRLPGVHDGLKGGASFLARKRRRPGD